MLKKRCLFCLEWFEPYIPRAAIQKIFGASKCRRKLKRMLDRAWRRRDPQWSKERRVRRRGGGESTCTATVLTTPNIEREMRRVVSAGMRAP